MTREAIEAVVRRYADDHDEAVALTEATLRRLAWRARQGSKVCASCEEAKPPAAFGLDLRRADGLETRCRACEAARKARSRTPGLLL